MKNATLFLLVIFATFQAGAQTTPAEPDPSQNEGQTKEPEITAPLSEVSERKPFKRWGLLVDAWVEGNMNGINRNDREGIKSDNARNGEDISEQWINDLLLRPTYYITDTESIAVGFEMFHSFSAIDDQERGYFKMSDTYLQAASSNLGSLGDIKFKAFIRPYLPTSERSQDPMRGQYLYLRGGATAVLPLNRTLTLSYWIEPKYFFSKNKSYPSAYNENGSVKSWYVNEQFRFKHWLGLNAEIGKFIGYQFVGITSRYFYTDSDMDGNTLARPQMDNLYWETGLGAQITDNITLLAGVYTETTNDFRRSDFVFFDDKEFLYFIDTTLTF